MVFFAVIILSGFISISAAEEACDLYGGVGENLSLPLNFNKRISKYSLKWVHNTKTLFFRDGKGQLFKGKQGDVSATGSLQLKNLQFSSAGVYEANVLSPNGNLVTQWSCRLCVMDKVSKPQLTYVCDFQSRTVNLNCNVSRPQGLDFSWMRNDTLLPSERRQTLSVSFPMLKEQRTFTCTVANKVSVKKSDTVRPTCTSPSSSPPNLLCFPSKTVVAAVAGGVSLILLLIVIVVVLCFYYRCNETQKGLREKGTVRMLFLKKLGRDSMSPDYVTMNPTENPRPPSPKPSPRDSYQNVPPLKAQPGNGPVQLSTVAQRQQPSPVPKQRTKTTNGMCLPQQTFNDKEENVKFAF
ncbi:SLAM family member 9-like [Platichthys flesus]|uniref:SLAM family member 9-like n=1 Tax=Platichthys flesus TaxID=8260 RepID=UPI002DBB27A3|nr:SLAM family member 9-like [Platichthys flesus]